MEYHNLKLKQNTSTSNFKKNINIPIFQTMKMCDIPTKCIPVQVSHDPHVTLEVVGLLPLGTDEAPLEDGLLAQPEESVEGVDLGVPLANLRLGELNLGLAEPVDPNESVHDCVVIFVFESLFYLERYVI